MIQCQTCCLLYHALNLLKTKGLGNEVSKVEDRDLGAVIEDAQTAVTGTVTDFTDDLADTYYLTKVTVDDIVLSDAFSPVTVTVYDADGNLHGTATDSVESYNARSSGSALNEAIMKFAYSAREYLS